jgi:riboflavin kinase/FMN adenylyltransferase
MDRVFDSILHFGREWGDDVCLAVGMFDGVHCGHRRVLDLAIKESQAFSGSAVAFTFPQHPATFLRPGKEPPLIMSAVGKAENLLTAGMHAVILQPFDHQLSRLEAEQFLPFLKEYIPSLKAIAVGGNFRFGNNRTGDSLSLGEMGQTYGIKVRVAESLILDGLPVSSSRIRQALSDGKISEVNQMLGEKYRVTGKVISGKALGRTIGFPTLNIKWEPQARPAFGVYAGIAKEMKSGVLITAIANYGMRPTVEAQEGVPLVEIHCLEQPDISAWKEGAEIEMQLCSFLRPEMKFDQLETLSAQIKKDCAEATKLLSNLL